MMVIKFSKDEMLKILNEAFKAMKLPFKASAVDIGIGEVTANAYMLEGSEPEQIEAYCTNQVCSEPLPDIPMRLNRKR